MKSTKIKNIELFRARIIKTKTCWFWSGLTRNRGYGATPYNGWTQAAHRVSWQIHRGPIPKGICVLHKCDNPPCVRPSHLWLGSVKDNNVDAKLKGRTARGDKNGTHLHPERLQYGESHHGSVLTEQKVKEIRQKAKLGVIYDKLSEEYNIARSTISQVVRRQTWKNVT